MTPEEQFRLDAMTMLAKIENQQSNNSGKIDRLVDAVEGNPEAGIPGLMERVAVNETLLKQVNERTPSKTKRAGIAGLGGVIGGFLALLPEILKTFPR